MFYDISFGFGIFFLNLLVGFLSPFVHTELESSNGSMLLTKDSDDFKPFIILLLE